MRKLATIISLFITVTACKSRKSVISEGERSSAKNPWEFTVAFGSCNKHTLNNLLWDDIRESQPDVWIWGGDIIYADTEDVQKISAMYDAQDKIEGYKGLKSEAPVIGTWDDHDYGLNDGGVEFVSKRGSQQAFLDFMDVPKDSPRRNREGVYASHEYELPSGKIKIIVLDTRYFRTALTPDTETDKRHKPNPYGKGTVLGEEQWEWLENELESSDADFNLLVSSIQVLSNEHGFECWGNFPHELDRLKKTIANSNAKGTMILSGDRHISEFSRTNVDGLPYPLVDFTSSGLTHAYRGFSGEPNPYRVGEVVSTESFGLVHINLDSKVARLQIIGDDGEVLGELEQNY